MHIAIAGNIGAGKTTLAGLLAKHYGWEVSYEAVDNNPYLQDFYEDMQRWSFNLQIYFLTSRFRQIMDIKKTNKTIVQDRTVYEDAYIFAPSLHAMGLMTTRDYNNYQNLFELMSQLVEAPDLVIYLRASIPALVNQIEKRGRKYENNIRIDYLRRLNERYEAWAERYDKGPILKLPIDNCNFSESTEDLSQVIDKINAELHGLF